MYICNTCGYENTKYFGLCPKCKEGIGEEFNLDFNKKGKQKTNINIQTVDKNAPPLKSSKITKFNSLNNILSSSKGFIDGQVILLGASPGIGKSTLCTSIADNDTLYISSEENYFQVNNRFLRINPDCNANILISNKIDEILEAIRITKQKLIIIDSLNSIEFGVGYLTTAKYADAITNEIKKKNAIGIIISQVAKNGEISGLNAIIHIVDTVLYLERSEISFNIIATSSKNRYGEIGEVALFRHESNGFVEIEAEIEENPGIGSTLTETKFGHKKLKISIDALVAVAQSAYGLRRANGYNQNRLIQLIGILSYYSKINFSDRDIYVNISNGLYTDDISIELAMANSILSSYYNKNLVKQAYGEVRLSGKIINGNIDGKNINHINELISMYES